MNLSKPKPSPSSVGGRGFDVTTGGFGATVTLGLVTTTGVAVRGKGSGLPLVTKQVTSNNLFSEIKSFVVNELP